MTFVLPYRPNPDEQRSIAGLLQDFDYVAGLINNGLAINESFVNGSFGASDFDSAVRERMGVNANNNKYWTASDEKSTTTADLDCGNDVSVDIPDLDRSLIVVSFRFEQRASDSGSQCKVSVRSETDSIQVTASTTQGITAYQFIDSGYLLSPRQVGITSTGTHTMGIHLHRVSGAGTVFVRSRQVWMRVIKAPT